MSDLPGAVAAILAETNGLLPTRHFDRCEAMTALGRATWMPCRCHERQAARQAAAVLRWLAAEGESATTTWGWGDLRALADEIEAGADGQQPEGGGT